MKAWMKILMWVGLGGGIGFFAGYQVGAKDKGRTERMAYEQGKSDGFYDCAQNEGEYLNAFEKVRKEYEGLGDKDNDNTETVKRIQEEEDPDMPEEVPVIGDEDTIEEIRELHPQDMAPVLITESEWNENPWNYDKETMGYYSLDDKLYNFATRSVIKDNDEVVGIGNLYGFYGTQENPGGKDIIFVRNDCLGTLFKIGFFDSALNDITGGADSPEYEEEEDEDETE